MTPADREKVSLAIATFMEQEPKWSKWMHDEMGWQKSDGGFWLGYRDDPTDDKEPLQKNVVSYTEPEVAMKLLKALLPFNSELRIWSPAETVRTRVVRGVQFVFVRNYDEATGKSDFGDVESTTCLEDAIALAFVKANGLEVG